MKRKVAALVALILPSCRAKNLLLRMLGWKIGAKVRIGFSYVYSENINMKDCSSIGHANFIKLEGLFLDEDAYIRNLNQISGPLMVSLQKRAAIGNGNKIVRAINSVSWGKAVLKLGELSKITSNHSIDCMRSVVFGDFSTLAGYGSQIWTHGYVHKYKGADRYRVDGSIDIGNNVYIGSGSIINPGIKIANSITVGSNSSVSKNLLKPGLYVNQSLRYLEFDYQKNIKKYPLIKVPSLTEKVVHKKHV